MNRLFLLVSMVILLMNYAVAMHWSNTDVPKINLTIEAVKGTSTHGSKRILCYPLTWPSLATFYIGNFGAHIATVQSTPGEKWPLTSFNMMLALFFPTSGLIRGLNAIVRNFSSSYFARNIVAKIVLIKRLRRDETSLEKACKAGALCIVVRNANWRPNPGQVNIPAILSIVVKDTASEETPPNLDFPDVEAARLVAESTGGNDIANTLEVSREEALECMTANSSPKETILTVYQPTWLKETQNAWWIYFDTLWGRNIVNPTLTAIHGSYKLPEGYSFSILPRNAIVQAGLSSTGVERLECEIATSYSILKILASIFQLLAATYILWLHRGDQITRWGFASFSFVPVPYAIMSLVNGISHLFTPDYPAVYMVSSTVMQEAEDAGGSFCGIVGHVKPAHSSGNNTGYGTGFDSNWKGLTPGILYRTIWSLYNSANGMKKQISELTVFAQNLPGHMQHEDQSTGTSINDETTGLVSTSNYAGLPVLLVQQSPTLHGESYMVRARYCSDNALEGIAYELPKVRLEWLRFGLMGIIVLLVTSMYDLAMHPRKNYRSVQEMLNKAEVQTFRAGREVGQSGRDDTASNIAIKGSLTKRLFKSLFSQSTTALKLEEQVRQDNLPHLSFRACERFQRHDDSDCALPIRTTTSQIRGFITQSFLGIVITGISLLVIGLMSGFRAGSSSKTEQIILMMWLAVGTVVGILVPFLNVNDAFTLLVRMPLEFGEATQSPVFIHSNISQPYSLGLMLVMCIPWSVFVSPIWGFVIIGQQLSEWGTCVTIY